MSTKRTPWPWKLVREGNRQVIRGAPDYDQTIVVCDDKQGRVEIWQDGRYIVECVNAFKGCPNPEKAMELMRNLVSSLAEDPMLGVDEHEQMRDLVDLLRPRE